MKNPISFSATRRAAKVSTLALAGLFAGLALIGCEHADQTATPTPKTTASGSTVIAQSTPQTTTQQTPSGAAATLPSPSAVFKENDARDKAADKTQSENKRDDKAQSGGDRGQTLSAREESKQMPMSGHGNAHSTPATGVAVDGAKPAGDDAKPANK